jgi:hypothetical protein
VESDGGSNSDNANSVQQTTDGGYIVAGHISSWVSDDDFWLIKTDENGNVEWDQTYGGYDSDNANSVQQTTDGGYIVAGFTESYGSGSKDVWLLKFAPEGSPYNPPQNLFVTELGYATWEAPEGAAVFTDDFDSYTAGEYLCTQTTDWATWGNTPGGTDDCYVVDVQANSGANSIEITGASDIIHPFGDLTTGAWGVSFMMYIEPTYGGYFNLLHEFTEWRRLRTEWALEAYFGSTGSGYLHAGGTNAATFTHPVGGWFEIETLIDLDADWAEFYVDGVFVHAWQWSLQFNGTPGLCQLGAIDIFAAAPAGDTPLFYIDDFAHTITTTERDLTGFNVYLDDMVTSIATVGADVFEYQYTDLTNGQNYIAGVSAVYDEGESDIVEYPFTYTGTEAGDVIVAATKLNNNYPNPFNPETNIAFSISEASQVTIEIYNLRGEKVKTLVHEVLPAGEHSIIWNGRDSNGDRVSSGIYFYKLSVNGKTEAVKKCLLLK